MKRLLILFSVAVVLAPVLILLAVKWEIRDQRRKVGRAVIETVLKINRLGARDRLDESAIKKAAVAPAKVEIDGTNPLWFKVEANTPWPDWMIYEYDSRTPARGIYHYLF
jgi:hypothetical protein